MTRGPTAPESPAPLRHLARLFSGGTMLMAYASGALFLLLSVYTTVDVIGRKFGGPYSGITDTVSSYVMATAATWALAYALRTGSHVRIDVFLPFFSPRAREILDLLAVFFLAVFAALLAFHSWSLAAESYRIGAGSVSIVRVPLEIPQGSMALGFTVLTVQALVTLGSLVARLLARDGRAER